ncbi:UDP-xylose and UDP-N-acetylglucosamine transporter [Acrasis kona]|uniref:UDP-xylose and UDP-N-acetylglucosamine transporter n=1 Tax=Acrasis kona TaxID=1008807 RepID=A0AAW2YX24_9EUKA
MESFTKSPIFIVGVIMIGCTFNVITFELILNQYKKSGSLVTVAQFLFMSAQGLLQNLDIGKTESGSLKSVTLKKRSTPLYFHLILVSLFFTQSLINNIAFNYDISLPLHSIFRSGSLITNMLVGVIIFGQRYPRGKVISVISITVGIILATYSSSLDTGKVFNQEIDYSKWSFGIFILSIAQIMAGLLGNLQQYGYKHYGKDYKENMFYCHVLSLPFFLFVSGDISSALEQFNSKPILWVYLLLNMATQYVCVSGVYRSTLILGTLTTTLVITVRKFISIIISLVYFDNTFTALHWVASALVFGGGIAFSLSGEEPKKEQTKQKSQ